MYNSIYWSLSLYISLLTPFLLSLSLSLYIYIYIHIYISVYLYQCIYFSIFILIYIQTNNYICIYILDIYYLPVFSFFLCVCPLRISYKPDTCVLPRCVGYQELKNQLTWWVGHPTPPAQSQLPILTSLQCAACP